MKRFYSQSTGTTYLIGVHQDIPADALEIPETLYLEVITNRPRDKMLAHDERGLPFLIDVQINPAVLEREWRDVEIAKHEWLVSRHRAEIDLRRETTISAERFAELQGYLQVLRDWPLAQSFPDAAERPTPPTWLVDLIP
ncbi:phage tail protein [Pseudomonas mosselii]